MRLSVLMAQLREAQRWFGDEDPAVVFRPGTVLSNEPERTIKKVKIRDGGSPVAILCESSRS